MTRNCKRKMCIPYVCIQKQEFILPVQKFTKRNKLYKHQESILPNKHNSKFMGGNRSDIQKTSQNL